MTKFTFTQNREANKLMILQDLASAPNGSDMYNRSRVVSELHLCLEELEREGAITWLTDFAGRLHVSITAKGRKLAVEGYPDQDDVDRRYPFSSLTNTCFTIREPNPNDADEAVAYYASCLVLASVPQGKMLAMIKRDDLFDANGNRFLHD